MLYKTLYCLLFICLANNLFSQRAIRGIVYDNETKEFISGVIVSLHENHLYGISDSEGKFEIKNLKAGLYHVHIYITGYEPLAQNIYLTKDTVLEIYLKPTYIELKNFVLEYNLTKTELEKSSLDMEHLDKKYLDKEAGNTLANSLEKIPGITSMNVGVGIAKPVIRGMTFNRVMVTDQGIKHEGQQWGADHGLEIDQFNVERLEILKGPASLLYGSDAMAGVINILPPVIPAEGHLNANIASFFRSNNNAWGITAVTEMNKKNNFFRIRYTKIEFADYKVPADSFIYNRYILPIYNEQLKNTAGKENNFSVTAGLLRNRGSARVTFNLYQQQAGLFAGAVGIPRLYQLTPDGNARNIALPMQDNTHVKLMLNLNFKLPFGWMENDLGYQNNLRKEFSYPHAHGTMFNYNPKDTLALHLNLHTYTYNMRLHFTPKKYFRNIAGLNLQAMQNTIAGFEYLIPKYTSTMSGAYFFSEYNKMEKTTVNAGVRLDVANMNIIKFDTYIYDINGNISDVWNRSPALNKYFFNFSGSAGISYLPKHELNFKINIGKSFRVPTAAEFGANGIHHGTFRHEMGDENLKAEHGYHLDAGIYWHDKRFILKGSPYFNYFSNYIFLRPAAEFSILPDAGQIYRYTQARAIHTGFEFYAEYHLIENLHLETSAEYLYNLNLDTYLPLPFTPPPSVSFSTEYETTKKINTLDNLSLGAELKYYFAQNRTDRNELQTPGYKLLSVFLSTQLKFNKHIRIEIYFKAHNLLNEKYLNHISRYRLLNIPEQGRNYSIMLKIPMQFILKNNTPVTN